MDRREKLRESLRRIEMEELRRWKERRRGHSSRADVSTIAAMSFVCIAFAVAIPMEEYVVLFQFFLKATMPYIIHLCVSFVFTVCPDGFCLTTTKVGRLDGFNWLD